MNNDLDISIVIPTYNGAKRLPNVLECLLKQTGVETINWEVIIIDNNSCDSTAEVFIHYQKLYNNNCCLKYFLETRQGIAFARARGVSEARGKFIAFVDDDNLPTADWVVQSYQFGQEHPQAGAWSGQIHGKFEVDPPENFSRIEAFFAVREHGQEAHIFDADNLRLPPGAALVVRKQAWLESVPQKLMFKGRLGKLMLSGDDTEALLYIYKAGWQIWYNPAMCVYHQIPCWRFEKEYLLNLARGCGLCIFYLRLINAKNWQKPIILFKTFLGNLRRILHHLIKYRGCLKTDIIALFEIEFYWASMMSPFHAIRCYLSNKFVDSELKL